MQKKKKKKVQSRRDYENMLFLFNTDFPYPKDPLTKSLEPDCLSPHTHDGDAASEREGRVGSKQNLI